MKGKHILLLLVASLMAISCHRPKHIDPLILQMDSLCNVNPEKALCVIDSLDGMGVFETEYAQKRMKMMRIKALDKMYKPHTDVNAMMDLTTYFERSGDNHDLLEAYYYMAGTYRDAHDVPNALTWYQKAVEYGERDIASVDSILLRNIYSQYAILLHRLKYEEEALTAGKREYSLSSDSLTDPQTPMDLATRYEMLYIRDSAYHYYQKAFDIIRERHQEARYIGIIAAQMSQYAMAGVWDKADECMSIIKAHPERQKYHNVAWSMGIYYEYQGKADSAVIYFRKALDDSMELGRKANAARNLLTLFNHLGERDSLAKYAMVYATLQDSVYEEQKREAAADVLNEFRYRRNKEAEEAAYRKALETRATGWMMTAVAALLVLAGSGGFMAYRQRQRRILNRTAARLRAAEHEQQLLEQSKRRLETEREAELQLRREMEVAASDVLAQLRTIASTPKATCDEALWEDVFRLVDKMDPTFSLKLKAAHPDISTDDVKLLYLRQLDLTQEQIGAILGCTRQTINRWLKRLRV